MSWGYRITILYLSFVALILTLVTKSMHEKVELVSPDYYAQELKFQDQLNGMNNAACTEGDITWEAKNNEVNLQLPEELRHLKISGTVTFYRPSDSELDQEMKLQVNGEGKQSIISTKFKRGYYKMKLKFTAGEKNYFFEKNVFMN